MKYETWKEPGAKGKAYYIFYGLKTTKDIEAAVKLIAKERKIALADVKFSTAWVKGQDLYLGKDQIVGAKKAIAIFRKGGK